MPKLKKLPRYLIAVSIAICLVSLALFKSPLLWNQNRYITVLTLEQTYANAKTYKATAGQWPEWAQLRPLCDYEGGEAGTTELGGIRYVVDYDPARASSGEYQHPWLITLQHYEPRFLPIRGTVFVLYENGMIGTAEVWNTAYTGAILLILSLLIAVLVPVLVYRWWPVRSRISAT